MFECVPTVSELISQRLQQKSQPGFRTDGFKLGLVLESGGMRGVVVGGEVTGLQALGVDQAIDSIYTVSCGSCAGYYLVSGQGPEGTSIYYNQINNRDFIDLRRLTERKAIDIAFLTYVVMMRRIPLDTSRVLQSTIPVNVYVTDAEDPQPVLLPSPKDRLDVHDAQYITCRVPSLAGLPIEYFGKDLTDGGVMTGGLPVQQAVEDGCSHLLVARSRDEAKVSKTELLVDRLLILAIAVDLEINGYLKLGQALLGVGQRLKENLNLIKKLQSDSSFQVQVEVIDLGTSFRNINMIETAGKRLRQGALDGFQATINHFRRLNLPINPAVKII
ncbi:hypothetical protein HYW46_01885 [Candidatus Daviesbacteria bacterium]|nr:hypothetical protein [Candidatus Daviesbacteria bacterium]